MSKKDTFVWVPPTIKKHDKVVVVCGTRTFNDRKLLFKKLDQLTANFLKCVVVTGGARGADKLAEEWAAKNWYTVVNFYPDWERHGKKAGPIRNREMARFATADGTRTAYCVAFWDGVSRGTADMIEVAKAFDMKVKIIRYEDRP